MKKIMKCVLAISLVALIGVVAVQAAEPEAVPQATCPVMGGAINKNLYVDVDGQRIYVCCGGCLAPIKQDPQKYIEKIKANGETVEKVPDTKKTTSKK